jgi:hypothetical protein
MRDLVSDPDFKGLFAVLMITRLESGGCVTCRAWVFDPKGHEAAVTVEQQA